MDNFKFNFLSRDELESFSLDKFFFTVFKILPCHEVFIGGFRGGAEGAAAPPFFFLVFSKRFCTTPSLLTVL